MVDSTHEEIMMVTGEPVEIYIYCHQGFGNGLVSLENSGAEQTCMHEHHNIHKHNFNTRSNTKGMEAVALQTPQLEYS